MKQELTDTKKLPLTKICQFLLVAIILFLFARYLLVNSEDVTHILKSINIRYLFDVVALIILQNVYRAYIWSSIIKHLGCDLTTPRLMSIWNVSLIGKHIPGTLWLVISRIYQLHKANVPKAITTYAVGLEQIVTLLSAFFIACVCPEIFERLNAPMWLGILLAPFSLLILFPNLIGNIMWAIGIRQIDLRLSQPPSLIIMIKYFIENILAHMLTGLLMLSTLKLFGLQASSLDLFTLTAISAASFAIGYISFLTPGGIGVREGIMCFLLSFYMPVPASILVAFSGRIWIFIADGVCIATSYIHLKNYDTQALTLNSKEPL